MAASGGTSLPASTRTCFAASATTGTLTHDERYDWAYEYVDVAYKLWEGLLGRRRTRPGQGTRNPLRPDEDPQDQPCREAVPRRGSPLRVSVAAAHAGAVPGRLISCGQLFSARNAEGVYISSPTPEAAHALTAETRALAADNGRDPDDITFAQGLSFVIGDTHAEAVRRNDELKRQLDLEGIALHALGDAGIDAGSVPLDTPISQLGEFTGVQSFKRWAAEVSGNDEPTIRDMAWVMEGANRVVGTAKEIADRLEEWREAGVNGINVYHATVPGSFREVADRLFPTLRERGLIATDKSGTLRHKLLGRGDRLPDTHPAAAHRGAFGDNDLLNNVGAPVAAAG